MSNNIYKNETVRVKLTLRDPDNNLYTPSALVIKAISPSGTTTTNALSDSPATVFADSTGVYLTYFPLAETGSWQLWWQASRTENGKTVIDIDKTELAVYAQAVFS